LFIKEVVLTLDIPAIVYHWYSHFDQRYTTITKICEHYLLQIGGYEALKWKMCSIIESKAMVLEGPYLKIILLHAYEIW